MRRAIRAAWAPRVMCAMSIGAANAQPLPRTHIKGVGETTSIINGSLLEQPLWKETIPQASGGMVTGDSCRSTSSASTTRPCCACSSSAAWISVRPTSAASRPTIRASRDAIWPASSLDFAKVRAACNAYRPVLDRLLSRTGTPSCCTSASRSSRCSGARVDQRARRSQRKKVRVFNKTMIDFLEGVGATGVSMAFSRSRARFADAVSSIAASPAR